MRQQRLDSGKFPVLEKHIRPYRNGNDITDKPRGVMAIDLLGLEEDEVRARYPEVYQWLLERVKPERDQVNREGHRRLWWLFGEPRKTLRPALRGLTQYIITVYVAKHRFFLFCNKDILPDDGLVAIASNDADHLGALSSKIDVCGAQLQGGVWESVMIRVIIKLYALTPSLFLLRPVHKRKKSEPWPNGFTNIARAGRPSILRSH